MAADRHGELAAWLRLTLTPGVGCVGQRALLKAFGPPEEIFLRNTTELAAVVGEKGAAAIGSFDFATGVDAALQWLGSDASHAILTLDDARYPKILLETSDPPTLMFAKGCLHCLELPALAIVGSRNATIAGVKIATAFSRAIASAGHVIVSGLALGIDAAGHSGALEAAGGRTIAIIGTGIDRVYPARNAGLAHQIVDSGQGLILSELPLGSAPLAHHFPRRNRLISGLSAGVLVVEAAPESGSLITARLAAEQGREVFAVPGSIQSPLSRGCHRLIRQGATLVETAQDVLSELPATSGSFSLFSSTVVAEATPERNGDLDLLVKLGHDPVTLDDLLARSGLTAEKALAMLFELELAGRVASLPGGRYQRLD